MKVQKLSLLLSMMLMLFACQKSKLTSGSDISISYIGASETNLKQALDDTFYIRVAVITTGPKLQSVILQDSRKDSVGPYNYQLPEIPIIIDTEDGYQGAIEIPVPKLFVRPYFTNPEVFHYEITVQGTGATSNTAITENFTVSQ